MKTPIRRSLAVRSLAPAMALLMVLSVLSVVTLSPSPAGAARARQTQAGYDLVTGGGSVSPFGGANFYGSMGNAALNQPVVGMAATQSGQGYWEIARDGGIFSFGDAQFYGSMGGHPLNKPIVGMAATSSGNGYWQVASDGGIFSFGDAQFYGSMGGHPLNKPVVGMAATPDGNGYWLVASDGGIFAYGDAQFYGSMGAHHLNKPVVGMATTADGNGYWLVASDGGIFSFGDAQFYGSTGDIHLNKPVVGMAATPDGNGYWLVASDGGIFSFGDAQFYGSDGGKQLDAPVVGMATTNRAPADASVDGCDTLMTAPAGHSCLLPWPNDAFSVATPSTDTGRRLNISPAVTPTNVGGVHVDTSAENQLDGFSPGSVIMTYVPNLDLSKSGIPGSTDIGSSTSPDSPIVIYDTDSGATIPYFAEIDAQTTDASEQLLLIHPAVALTEGHRYAIALRNLVDTFGNPIQPLASTRAALNGTLLPATRGAHIAQVINGDLASVLGDTVPYEAWDFTVASAQSLAGPALSMRTQAYQWLDADGNHMPVPVRQQATTASTAPTSTVPATTTPTGNARATGLAPNFTVTSNVTTGGVRDVQGTFQVPLFLGDTTEYSAMHTGADGMPAINGNQTWTANFICVMPSTVQSGGAAMPIVYGHGLLGSASEVEGSSFSALVPQDRMGCATDWVGMSASDLGNVARNLSDMSTWNTQVDHMLQGFVNFQFLGRLLNSPDGFGNDAAFQDDSGAPLFQVGQTAYLGYSQGGIMGGAVSALSNEWTRVVLGEPGMDYGGVLLNRSVDWNEFSAIFDVAYTDPVDQQIVLQIAQLLWDQGESDGYAQHLTSNPYPGTDNAKQVFIIENYGDHQVANVSTEMLARTIGAANHQPAFNASFMGGADRLNIPVAPQWGLSALDQTQSAPAGLVLWDYGTPTPPTDNLAPNGAAYGADPHGFGRHNNVAGLSQITSFLDSGIIPDVCNGAACQSSTP
jgi:hypothetical protein